ncbi:MAG: porin [Burkholderiales bacterium]|nr:porin [Burkholderiales bacterium]MDE1925590.1 porin [Burkholderiales bacterium]MDE2503249.1 porin [Burkholderiales bacterium]
MKSDHAWWFAAAFLTMGAAAHAQSAVTIYGIVDAGVTYYDNVGGQRAEQMDTGVAQGSRLGFRGAEDMGGGLRALFNLENGFNTDTGTVTQGGVFFGRQATVGLSGGFGTVNLGRQYDFMFKLVNSSVLGQTPAGLMGDTLPSGTAITKANNAATGKPILGSAASLSARTLGVLTNNSIRYDSPSFGGLTFGVMYGLGEVPGAGKAGSTWSAGMQLVRGPFNGVVAYYDATDPTGMVNNRAWGIGANYSIDQWTPFAEITRASYAGFSSAAAPNAATTYTLGTNFRWTLPMTFSLAYQRQQRNNGFASAQQWTAVADYRLSKRTDVYATVAHGVDKAFHPLTMSLIGLPSSSDKQTALHLGVRHTF